MTTATACAVLRHHTVERWVGDIRAIRCLECDCMYFPLEVPKDAPVPASSPQRHVPARPWRPRVGLVTS